MRAVYNGVLIGTHFLAENATARRSGTSLGIDPRTNYVIGQSRHADAPAASEFLGGSDLPLVSRWSEGFLVNVTPQMTGVVAVGGKVYRLADYLAGRGSNFKYCYDQELTRKAGLAGRISVQFVISPVGQVISSVMQSTTMNELRVEKCVVDAVKRWEFPKPTGGGIAIVSYPFSFAAGGG